MSIYRVSVMQLRPTGKNRHPLSPIEVWAQWPGNAIKKALAIASPGYQMEGKHRVKSGVYVDPGIVSARARIIGRGS